MGYRFIKTEQKGEVGIIRLNHPETLNAINRQMMDELAQELGRLESDPQTRALILTGEGRGFCSGANIKEMSAQGGAKELEAVAPSMQDLTPHLTFPRGVIYQLWRLGKTTIAAINGPCITTGVGLSAACDFRIASEEARIGWVFLQRGLPPDDGSLGLLINLLGYSKTYKLGVLGDIIPAQRALEIGFLDELVPSEELIPACLRTAQKIIEGVPPLAQQMFKRLAIEAQYASFEETARQVRLAFHTLVESSDHAEAIRAFADRRKPQWTGS